VTAARDGPLDGAPDAVARLADPELALGLLEGDPGRPPDETGARGRLPRSVAGCRSCADTTLHTGAGRGLLRGLSVPAHRAGLGTGALGPCERGPPHAICIGRHYSGEGRTHRPQRTCAVPAAPDQTAPPTPPLTSPRNAGGGVRPAETTSAASRGRQQDRALQPGRRRGRAAAAVRGSLRALGAPTCDCGGSAEPPPRCGQRPVARGRRRGSTRRAAAAAVGRCSCRDGLRRRVASRRHPLQRPTGER
jgi:hypothetical protein